MDSIRRISRAARTAITLTLLFSAPPTAIAERLPFRTFTMADGLPRDHITRIVPDSKGYLWFCTSEGLSRFDGYKFTNYGEDEGLANRQVNDLVETKGGVYWVATQQGMCRFNPDPAARKAASNNGQPEKRFTAFYPANDAPSRNVLKLQEDHTGTLWCATGGGLYKCDLSAGEPRFSRMTFITPGALKSLQVRTLAEDIEGSLWIAASSGLYRRLPNGEVQFYKPQKELPAQFDLMAARDGRIWAATAIGLVRLAADPKPGGIVVDKVYTTKDGLSSNGLLAVFQSSDGTIWTGCANGISRYLPGVDQSFRSFGAADGLTDPAITTFAEDHNGSIWIGTDTGGATRLSSVGFSTYTESDGLGARSVKSLRDDREGRLCVVTGDFVAGFFENTFDGTSFRNVQMTLPKGFGWSWGWNQISFQDSRGEWWLGTATGLLRYSKMDAAQLATAKPKAIYTIKDGLPANEIFRLYEDSRGDVWISTLGNPNGVLTRWDRASETFHVFRAKDGVTQSAPSAFREDAAGNVWIGLYNGGLMRYTNGKFEGFTSANGVPPGFIEDIYLDHANRLWVATDESGVFRIDQPTAPHLTFVKYSVEEGLSSDQADSVTEDRWGMIYVGTGRGVDRIDPQTGQVKHFTTADGLAGSEVFVAFRHRDGSLWFGTGKGLSRLIPRKERADAPPPITVDALRVSGVDYPLSDLGVTQLNLPTLRPTQNDVEIDFGGINLGESLQYEYKMEGASSRWSKPTNQRSVNFPSLSPGSYRFLVRSVTPSGVASASPASVSFTILPPLWQRWWFLAGAVVLLGVAVYLIDRYRVARLLELERVRTRIATDLHDDIGASLSRMAILSEVVKQQTASEDEGSATMLTDIADSARGLVDSMSDIVWSIDPTKDDLTNVVTRVRAFASDVLEPKGIHWELATEGDLDRVKLSPDHRRHIYLIYKEAINNIARHSGCVNAHLRLTVVSGSISFEISDDGKGLKDSTSGGLGGNGLRNMGLRVADLGGTLTVESPPEGGTILKFKAQIK